MSPPPDPRTLAAELPDEPLWIDLRGLLFSGRCDIDANPQPASGFVARSWDYPFAAMAGRPEAALLAAAVRRGRAAFADVPGEEWQLLALPQARAAVAAALPDWRPRRAILHRWPRGSEPADLAVPAEIVLLAAGHQGSAYDLGHVPEASRWELELEWVASRPMAVAVIDRRPVTFCYAAVETESLWDVSIETLGPYRRRGLAGACFAALARHMARRGKVPAWGAMADNPASLGLAAKLGFVPAGEILAWEPTR